MMRHHLKFIIFCQFVLRVIRLSLFYERVTRFYGFLNEKAWVGAAFNFFLYVLASHVVGAIWYLFAIESQLRCWSIACERENSLIRCSLGQGLKPYYGEILFSYLITAIGLILLALIIGNMQKYLQTFPHLTLRLEKMKEARRDAEEFMLCVSLLEELRHRVRRYKHYKWKITKGVDLDTIVRDLPRDLRRDIKRHLCLPSLHKFFADMEDKLLDVTCELMKPVFYTRNSQITRVGYPIGEMVFITSGGVNMTNGYCVELYFGCVFGEEIVESVLRPESSSSSGVLPVAF